MGNDKKREKANERSSGVKAEDQSGSQKTTKEKDEENTMEDVLVTARVKNYNPFRGFGFLKLDQEVYGKKEAFIHATKIQGGEDLRYNDIVSAQVFQGDRGLVAFNCQILKRYNEREN